MSSCRSGPAEGAGEEEGSHWWPAMPLSARTGWVGDAHMTAATHTHTHNKPKVRRDSPCPQAGRQAHSPLPLPPSCSYTCLWSHCPGAMLLNRVTCQKKHRPRQEWARYKRVNNNKAKTNKSATKAKDETGKKRKQRRVVRGGKGVMNGTRCQTIFQFELPESESPLPPPLPSPPRQKLTTFCANIAIDRCNLQFAAWVSAPKTGPWISLLEWTQINSRHGNQKHRNCRQENKTRTERFPRKYTNNWNKLPIMLRLANWKMGNFCLTHFKDCKWV